ncbi:MAG: ABC transporter permease [Gemmatimonadota bacterium]
MGRPRGVRRLFRLPAGRRRTENEVELEFRHHLEMRIDELVDEGYRPDEARRIAEAAFGSRRWYRQQCVVQRRREARMTWMRESIGNLTTDVRYALRGIRKQPGFAAAVVLTLGLGIGANTAIFTVVDHLLLRDLPFVEPDDLYTVHARGTDGFLASDLPSDMALALDRADGLGRMYWSTRLSAVRNDGPEPTTLVLQAIEPGFTSVFGLPPTLGRPFNPDDALPGASRAVLLSHSYWVSQYGRDPDIVGRGLVIDSIPLTVVGVMRPEFRYPLYGATQLYVPLASDATALGREFARLEAVTRLAPEEVPGVEAAAARFVSGLRESLGDTSTWLPAWSPMNRPMVNPDVRRALYVSLGAVTLMLLVALLNGVNLMLVRGTTRSREIGVRLALGGSRTRVVAQMLAESAVLALLSGAAAVVLAVVGVEALWSMAPGELTFFGGQDIGVDGRILAFVALVSTGSGLLFGLIPALRAVTAAGATSGTAMSTHAASGRRPVLVRQLLVVGQVAVSLTLLFGAGLMGRSFHTLVSQDPGMDPEGLVTMNVQLSPGRYPDENTRAAFLRGVTERLWGIPGVTAVTVGGMGLPGTAVTFGDGLYLEGEPAPVGEGFTILPLATADPTLRVTLGTRLIAGRDLRPEDRPDDRRVLATETLARRLGATSPSDAIGQRFTLGEEGRPMEVVGVVEDARLEGMDPRFGRAAFFRLYDVDAPGHNLGFLVRAEGAVPPLREAMQAAVRAVDPGQPIQELLPLQQILHDSVQKPRFFLTLMAVFAGSGLFLAAIGLYGVLSFSVSQRLREMGVRLALGAAAQDVRGLVFRSGLALATLGTLVGVALALAVSGALEGLLFETSATDLGVLAVTAIVLLGAAALASYVPALRATRVDPVAVLKAD